ncbi:MAG: hypothetical protein INQ03_04440 [Candidatus Heimdallarchaeota archaeon]|nr:hypothetical protein [Candidatus Heimdallarchaeota archaeon]
MSEKIKERVQFYSSPKGLIYIFSSPTFIWFFSLYITTLIMMISLNVARLGFNIEGLTTGPQYFMNLFMFYGLNAAYTSDSFILHGGAWLLGPFVAVFMGLGLIILKEAGFSYNGLTEDPLGTMFYAFFREDVYGYDIHLMGEKGNVFYFSIVWIPIITSTILVIVASRRLDRRSSVVSRFLISFIIAIMVGNAIARISDPNLTYSIEGFFKSLFIDRERNHFVVYQGEYPPMMLATFFTFLQIIPMIIMAFFELIILFYNVSKLQYEYNQKLKKENMERREALSEDEYDLLPWEIDLKARKKAKKDSKGKEKPTKEIEKNE